MNTASNATSANNVFDYLRLLFESGFWGNITLKLQRGQVVHVIREESIQPEQLVPEYRRERAEHRKHQ